MKYKKHLLVICLIICLFGMASVSAGDTDDVAVASDQVENDMVSPSESVVIAVDSDGTFADLASEIAEAEGELNLTRNYVYSENDTVIPIFNSTVINGNGHIIDANNQSGIFFIENDVTINNLTLINANSPRGSVFTVSGGCQLTTNYVILENNTANLGVILVGGQYISNNDRITDSVSSNYGVITLLKGANLEINNAFMMSSLQLSKGFIFGAGNNSIIVSDSTFLNTTSSYSTAVYGSKITRIKNSKFINLHAEVSAGAIAVKGAEECEIDNCTFINVTSEKNAGAVFADVYNNESNVEVSISNSSFVNSYSGFGGAVMQLGGTLKVTNCNFTDNSALFDGGAIYASNANVSLSSSMFYGNHAEYEGNDRTTYGGTIFSDYTGFNSHNCLIANSYAGCGSAIYLYDSNYLIENTVFIDNFDLEGNYDDIFTVFDGPVTILENNVYSGEDSLSFNNTDYQSIMAAPGMKLTLINATINVTELPPKFDLRDWGWVTPVKDQGSMGSCWAFGTAGAAESAILRYLGFEMDISENNMQDVSLQYFKFGTKTQSEGGDPIMGSKYALSWFGVFSSEYDTYDELGKISPIIAAYDSIHFQDVVFIPARKNTTDNNLLKEAILKYGALSVTYCAEQTAPYYNQETSAQYRNSSERMNHGVTLIGWDDDFSASNFLITPPGDGAWIFKNSWGESSGDGGYFYISYYDPTFVTQMPAVGFVLENTVEYNKNYQYDIGGGLDYINASNEYLNIFKAVDDDLIAGVGTYFNEENVDYSVEVYVNDDLRLEQSGVSPFAGFHTIQLDSYVPIKEGDLFTVKIKSDCVPILYLSRQHFIAGSSQYLENGTWIDATLNNLVCCIKVYTIDETKHNTSLVVTYDDENGVLTATLTDEEGNAIEGADVGFKVDDDTYVGETDSEGQVVLLTEDFVPGTYSATIYYEGDVEFNPSSITCEFTVKADIAFDAVHDVGADELVVTFTNNATGKPVSGAYFRVEIEDVNATVKTNSKGQAKVSTADLPYGEYTATFSYAGNAKYNPLVASIDFNTKDEIDISAVYDAEKNEIIAILTNNATGKAVSNAKVNVNLNGENQTVKTNSKGQFKVSTADLPLGKYTATISYAGNSKYNPASASIDVNVKTNVIITDIYGDSDKLVARLTNGETGNPIANANMVVDINGVKTTVKSNSKGKISVDTSDLGVDSYGVTISYPGNSRYNPSSATTTVDLNKANMVITYVYDAENQELTATLKNSKTGKAVSNANMVVDLGGAKTTLKSNSKGQIIFSTADWTPGTYVGTISYGGNSKYNSISAAFKVDI